MFSRNAALRLRHLLIVTAVSGAALGCATSVSHPGTPPVDPADGSIPVDPALGIDVAGGLGSPSPIGTEIAPGPVGPAVPAVDPARLAVEAAPGARLGTSIAVSGDTAVAGAPGEQSVYVLELVDGAWKVRDVVETPDPAAVDFGARVAWDGKHLAVGAIKGRAFLFRLADDGSLKLIADIPADGGASAPTTVAFPASFLAVGSAYDVRLFAIQDAGVELRGSLRPANAAEGFGAALASDGSDLIVGAPGEGHGAAYVFRHDGDGELALKARLALDGDDDEPAGSGFGESVAIAGGVAMVGAPREGVEHLGAVHVWVDSEGTWKRAATLRSPRPATKDFFGTSIALTPETVLIGSVSADARFEDTGAVFVFDHAALDGWVFGEVLVARDGAPGDLHGAGVATDGRTFAIGAPAAGPAHEGAVYLH